MPDKMSPRVACMKVTRDSDKTMLDPGRYVGERGSVHRTGKARRRGTMMVDGLYAQSVIREREEEVRTLDLLQAWGSPIREPLRVRLGKRLVTLGRWLQGAEALPPAACPAGAQGDSC